MEEEDGDSSLDSGGGLDEDFAMRVMEGAGKRSIDANKLVAGERTMRDGLVSCRKPAVLSRHSSEAVNACLVSMI
jgi:hypothetical protein